MGKFRTSRTTNVDHYCNVHRQFKFEADDGEYIALSSGSSAIHLAVKGFNNGYVHLTDDMIDRLIKELEEAKSFSMDAKADMAAYWKVKNATYSTPVALKSKYGKDDE